MKIGYIYNLKINPPRGGNHVHALHLVRGFAEKNHQVGVVDDSTVTGIKGVTNFSSSAADLKNFSNWLDILYVRIDGRYIAEWQHLADLQKLIGEKPIVWEINAPANETLAFSFLGGLKHWNRKHESFFKRIKRQIHASRKYFGIVKEERIRKKLARRVNAAICVSKALGDYAEKGLKIKNVLVVPNGGPIYSKAENEVLHEIKSEDYFTVLYSGSAMYPWQGLNFLSETIKLAQLNYPSIRFVMAVNQRSEYIPSSPNLKVLECLDQNTLMNEIRRANLCVAIHPEYFWSKWKFHGSSMKMFEYMACQTTVLASNVGQMRDILQDEINGLLCENTPESILTKIVWATNNLDKLEDIASSGWQLVQEEYNWKNNAIKTLSLFQSLLNGETSKPAYNRP